MDEAFLDLTVPGGWKKSGNEDKRADTAFLGTDSALRLESGRDGSQGWEGNGWRVQGMGQADAADRGDCRVPGHGEKVGKEWTLTHGGADEADTLD